MRIHDDWATPAFAFRPAAQHVGPFPGRGFLEAWWGVHGDGDLLFVESDDTLLTLCEQDGVVSFVGAAGVTDYHSPLGPNAAGLAALLVDVLPPGARLVLDSLPGESAEALIGGLVTAGIQVSTERHEAAAVLDLAATYEEHLGRLSQKERHETRRKLRRLTEAYGEPRLVRDHSAEALEAFVGMHRSAPGEKGRFLDEQMESFFSALLGVDGVALDLLLAGDGSPLAAAFGFECDDAYYLYNSSFDSKAGAASPGAVLVDRVVAAAIEEGISRFDFLKGDEAYKFRMGAVERPLFVLEAAL